MSIDHTYPLLRAVLIRNLFQPKAFCNCMGADISHLSSLFLCARRCCVGTNATVSSDPWVAAIQSCGCGGGPGVRQKALQAL